VFLLLMVHVTVGNMGGTVQVMTVRCVFSQWLAGRQLAVILVQSLQSTVD
jgi:hypothetical protein